MHPLVAVLATKRLTQLIVEDEISAPIRDRIERWAGGHPYGSPQERLAYLVGCSACASIWAGALILLAGRTRAGRIGSGILAASAAALAVDAAVQRLER